MEAFEPNSTGQCSGGKAQCVADMHAKCMRHAPGSGPRMCGQCGQPAGSLFGSPPIPPPFSPYRLSASRAFEALELRPEPKRANLTDRNIMTASPSHPRLCLRPASQDTVGKLEGINASSFVIRNSFRTRRLVRAWLRSAPHNWERPPSTLSATCVAQAAPTSPSAPFPTHAPPYALRTWLPSRGTPLSRPATAGCPGCTAHAAEVGSTSTYCVGDGGKEQRLRQFGSWLVLGPRARGVWGEAEAFARPWNRSDLGHVAGACRL